MLPLPYSTLSGDEDIFPPKRLNLQKLHRLPKFESVVHPKAASAVATKMANVIFRGEVSPGEIDTVRMSRPLATLMEMCEIRIRRLFRSIFGKERYESGKFTLGEVRSTVNSGCFGPGAGDMLLSVLQAIHPREKLFDVATVAAVAESCHDLVMVCTGLQRTRDHPDFADMPMEKSSVLARAVDIAENLDNVMSATAVRELVNSVGFTCIMSVYNNLIGPSLEYSG